MRMRNWLSTDDASDGAVTDWPLRSSTRAKIGLTASLKFSVIRAGDGATASPSAGTVDSSTAWA